MMTACLLVWCFGGPIERAAHRITFANDVRHSDRTERIFAYEFPWMVVGATLYARVLGTEEITT